MLIKREITKELLIVKEQYPVITITGPRQSGKTTLVKNTFPDKPYVSLEDPDIRELALLDPRAFLGKYKEGVILDEIQRVPDLLSYIQTIVDKKQKNGMFILTGSQNISLMDGITQSLAGRTAILKLLPFSIKELESKKIGLNFSLDEFLLKGFFPRIYDKKLDPTKAYRNYYETYIERDVKRITQIQDLMLFQKFIRLCAGRVGQIFVASQLANEVGVSTPTIQSWLSVLQASYVIFLFQPYYSNINKRLIKSPKLYFYDVGLASYLLNIEKVEQIERDPLRGALFENLVILELIKSRFNQGKDHNLYFYRDSNQNEIDIVAVSGNNIMPIEIKSAQTFNKEFLNSIQYIKKLLPDKVMHSSIVYAGNEEQKIQGTYLLNYRNLNQINL